MAGAEGTGRRMEGEEVVGVACSPSLWAVGAMTRELWNARSLGSIRCTTRSCEGCERGDYTVRRAGVDVLCEACS